ncbi:MAG: hypothetical protein ACRC8J_03595 [Phocaeicola sp.]
MKQINLLKLFLLTVVILGFSGCQDKEEIEFNLPGAWYTEEEIYYGDDTAWGRGTQLTFSSKGKQGTIGTSGAGDFLIFTWDWYYQGYNTLELSFPDGTYAYIGSIQVYSNRLTGTWYNSLSDFNNSRRGQSFYMHRVQ